MKFIWTTISAVFLLSASACSTPGGPGTPQLAAAKSTITQNADLNLSISEKDYTFNAPIGFQGPLTVSKEKYSRLSAFSSTEEKGTVITVHSGYSKTPLWDPSADMQKSVVHKHMLKMISGIENRRTNYNQSNIEFLEINGIQMGKISWTGDSEHGPMKGTMYSFLKSGNNHTFAVQGFANSTSAIYNAYEAVENIRIGN